MKRLELTYKQMSSVPCPTCGVIAGKGCVLYSGGLRAVPHPVRKLSAIAAIEKKLGNPVWHH